MKKIVDEEKLKRIFVRLAHEVVERNDGTADVALLGIQRSGVAVAERMQSELEKIEGLRLPTGALDVTLYRDDLLQGGGADKGLTLVDFPVDGKKVVLCDDVLHTGRSVRAAIEAIFDLGRPARVMLLVLCDRGGREMPVSPDFVGKNVPTSRQEFIDVRLAEIEGEDSLGITQAEK